MVKVVNHGGALKVSSKKASPIKKGKTLSNKKKVVVLSKKNGKKTAAPKVTKKTTVKKGVKKSAAQPKQMWDFFAEDSKYKKL